MKGNLRSSMNSVSEWLSTPHNSKKVALFTFAWLLFRHWKKRYLQPRITHNLQQEAIPLIGNEIKIQTQYGITTAIEMGPSDAKETILFLHGFPDTRHTFFRQLSFFAEAGYRVIAPTLPGYELSCVPSSYHIANIARVVVAWIDALKQNRVHIVGHDWGAVITYVACNLAPHRFYSAVTVAIPHLRHFKTRLHLLPSQFRFFAEWCVQRDKCAFIDKLWVDWSPDHPTYTLEVKRLFRNKAILKNALAYYRALPDMFSSAGRETERLSGAPLRVPCLAVTGARDGCMDTRLHDMLMDPQCFSAPYRIKRLAQSGHFAHQEEWQVFNRWVLEWIQRYSRTYLESGEAPSSSTL